MEFKSTTTHYLYDIHINILNRLCTQFCLRVISTFIDKVNDIEWALLLCNMIQDGWSRKTQICYTQNIWRSSEGMCTLYGFILIQYSINKWAFHDLHRVYSLNPQMLSILLQSRGLPKEFATTQYNSLQTWMKHSNPLLVSHIPCEKYSDHSIIFEPEVFILW